MFAKLPAMLSGASILDKLHALATEGRPGAIVIAEHAIDTYAGGFDEPSRVIALDTILRDLARLRIKAPTLDPFVSELERYIDGLHRELAKVLDTRA